MTGGTTPSPKSAAGTLVRKILAGQILPHPSDPNKVRIEIHIDQKDGTKDWIPFDIDKSDLVDLAKQILRQYNPQPSPFEEQLLDVLREIRDRMGS